MNKYLMAGLALFGLVVLGGIIALGTRDNPAPQETVETQIDASRFTR